MSPIHQVTRQGIVSWVEKSHEQGYPIDSIVDVNDSNTVRVVIKVPPSVNRHKNLRIVSLRWAFAPEATQFNAYCIVQGDMLAGESLEDACGDTKSSSCIMFEDKAPPDYPVQRIPERAPIATKWRLTAFPQNPEESDVLAVIRLEVKGLAQEHIPPDIVESLRRDETLSLSPIVLNALGIAESPVILFEYVFKVDNERANIRQPNSTSSTIRRRNFEPPTEGVTDRRRTNRKPRLSRGGKQMVRYMEDNASSKRQRQAEAGPSRDTAPRPMVPEAANATSAVDGETEDVDINKVLELIEEEERLKAQVGPLYATKKAIVERLREVTRKLAL